MNLADEKLIGEIQQITQGSSRLLVTLARRGKALERDTPQRAALLLAAVVTHPLYKGGRLTFDMLEIEDLILDNLHRSSMSTRETIQILRSSARHLPRMLREIALPDQSWHLPQEAPGGSNVLGGAGGIDPSSAAAHAGDISLPRVSFGPAQDLTARETGSSGSDDAGERDQSEPKLLSSDYLYDYVVLGLMDIVGRCRELGSSPGESGDTHLN